MASFAPGTSQQYIEDYYRRVGPSLGGTGPEDRGAPYGPQRAAPQTLQYGQTRGMTPSKPGPGRPSVPMQRPSMTPSKPGPGRPSVLMAPSYSPGQAKPQQSPYATSTPYGQKPMSPRPRHSPNDTLASGGGQPANRPPPFQATTQNFDGTTSQMPNFQQRDAFIAQINNQLGQMQNQSWQRPGMGAPQFNFPQMWGQAGEMAEQGFRNPFAAPQQQGPPAGQGRRMSESAWNQMYPGQPYPTSPPPSPGAYY